MAGTLQHLRSATLDKRPNPASMVDGQVAINYADGSPGLFFKDSNGDLVKVGPVHVGSTAPNATPAGGGTAGNSVGEQWLDTSGSTYVFKIWDGTAWRSEAGEFVNATGDTMTGALVLPSGTEGAPALGVGSADNGLYSPGTDQVAISTNGAERLRITSDGKLGLGTSAPDELLHIEGDTAEFKGTNTNPVEATVGTEQVFKFGIEGQKNGVYGPVGSIIFRQDELPWSVSLPNYKPTRIEFCTQNSSDTDNSETPRLVIDRVGRVGIGTTTPSNNLNVVGIADFDGGSASTTSRLRIQPDEATKTVFLDSRTSIGNSEIAIKTGSVGGSTERLRVDGSGRLLVGTSSARQTSTITWKAQLESAGELVGLGITTNLNTSSGAYLSLAKSRGTSVGSNTIVVNNDNIGTILFSGADGVDANTIAARIDCAVDGTPGANDMPGRLVFSVTADGSASPTEALRISNDRSITVSDGGDVVLGTTTGTKIGTATSQKIGFYNATPVVQPTTGVAEAAFVENSGGTAVNVDSTFGGYTIQQVVEALQTLGLLA